MVCYVCQVHKGKRLVNPFVALMMGEFVELGKDQQILVAGQGSIGRERLQDIANHALYLGCLPHDVKADNVRAPQPSAAVRPPAS